MTTLRCAAGDPRTWKVAGQVGDEPTRWMVNLSKVHVVIADSESHLADKSSQTHVAGSADERLRPTSISTRSRRDQVGLLWEAFGEEFEVWSL